MVHYAAFELRVNDVRDYRRTSQHVCVYPGNETLTLERSSNSLAEQEALDEEWCRERESEKVLLR